MAETWPERVLLPEDVCMVELPLMVGNVASRARGRRPRGAESTGPRETSIRRGIETFLVVASEGAAERGGLSVTAIAEQLGREKSQVSRALAALADYGLLDRDPDTNAYRLGWRIYAIANLGSERRLIGLAEPRLAQLVARFGETSYLSVRQGTDTITVVGHRSPRSVQAVSWIGRATPAYSTSVGKALLLDYTEADLALLFEGVTFERIGPNTARDVAELSRMIEKARQLGFATADEELEADLFAVAAPVRDTRGRIIAALSISGPKFRLQQRANEVSQALVATADALAAEFSGQPRKDHDAAR
jgi:DNA-binding IclR family transcriptional regulator